MTTGAAGLAFSAGAKLIVSGSSLAYADALSGVTLMNWTAGKGPTAASLTNLGSGTSAIGFDSRFDPFLSWRDTKLKLYLYGNPFSHWTGGDGTWDNASVANSGIWYDAERDESDRWSGRIATFGGATAGTVMVNSAGSEVVFQGANFNTSGYVITGGSLTTNTAATTLSTTTGVTARIDSIIAGTGGIDKTGAGTLILGGNNTYTGATTISSGTLSLIGRTAAASAFTVRSGAVLAGTGTAPGSVNIAAGGILEGRAGQRLTLGSLTLDAASIVNVSLNAAPGTIAGTQLFEVGGALALDGTLNITDIGGFNAGIYRLFTYGSITDNGLTIGASPVALSNLAIISGGGYVDLVYDISARDTWIGGAGTWSASPTSTQWTNADSSATSGTWTPQFAVFKKTPAGAIAVDNASGPVAFTGMQFAIDGYTISSGSLSTSGTTKVSILVGDGSGGASFVAKIGSIITGTHTIEKGYLGKLVLTGSNNYTGNTIISGGVLQLGDGGAAGSINGNVDNRATLAFNRSDTYIFGGTISGAGAVRQDGPGKTVLTADNTYTGATTITGGTLQIGNGGATGGVAGNIANNATLVFNRSGAYTYSGTISGGGAVRQESAGTLIFTGNNTGGGVTTIASGTLQLGDGGASGGVAGAITNNSALAVNRSDNATLASAIGGSGAFYLIGSGKTTLSGVNTYTGATIVRAGELGIAGALSASSTVSVESGGRLSGSGTAAGAVVIRAGGILYGASGNLFTMGSLTMQAGSNLNVALGAPPSNVEADTGLFKVNGDVSLSGTLNVAPVDLNFGTGIYRLITYTGSLLQNDMVFGALPGGASVSDMALNTSVTGRVSLVYSGSLAALTWKGGSGVWSAASSGTNWSMSGVPVAWNTAVALFYNGPGTVTIDTAAGEIGATKIQFASDGFTVTGGALTVHSATTMIQVGDASAAGAGMTATISAPIAGSGGINKTDLGTLVLSGTNTYGAGTRVSGGVLQVSSDVNLGAATGTLTLASGTLRAGANFASARGVNLASASAIDTAENDLELSGLISGGGALNKLGAGRLIVSNQYNSLTGLATVRAGELVLRNGKLAAVTVQSGAALRGAGSLSGNLINGGLLSPGENPGELATIDIAGGFTQQASGHSFMEIASPASFDLVRATGNIVVGGTLSVQMLGGYIPEPGQTFTLFATTASVSGSFAAINALDMGLLKFLGAPTASGYQLTVAQQAFSSVGGNKNQKAIGAAMDAAVANGELGELFRAFANYTTADGVLAGLDQLSAAPYAHWFQQAVYMTDATTRAAENRLASSFGGPRDLWFEYTHNETQYDATYETARADVVTDGFLLGADFPTSGKLRLGVLFGYDFEKLTYDNLGSTSEADRYIAGLYGRVTGREYFVDTVIGGGWAKVDTNRVISIPGYSRIARSMANESEFFVNVRAGFPVPFGKFVATPYLKGQYVNWSMGGFDEEEAGAANLNIQRQSNGSFAGTFGLNFHMPFDAFGITWTPRLDLGLRHEFRDKSSAKITAEIGGVPYTVRCSEGRATGYVATFGLDAVIIERVTAYVRVTSEKDTAIDKAYDIRAGFELRF